MKTEETNVSSQKSMHEIIDETVEFYSNNPRSVVAGRCKYRGANGAMCAFARMITNPQDLEEGLSCGNKGNWKVAKFKPEYEGHNPEFYVRLQQFHDSDINWSSGGLSADGEYFVAQFKQQFNG